MTPLRRRRFELGWPQWKVALRSGVAVGRISFAERGLIGLSWAERRALAEALETRHEDLFPEEQARP